MKDQVDSKAARLDRSSRSIRAVRVILCVFSALTICLCCALLGFIYLRAQPKALLRDADTGIAKIRIYIDQGHNPAPYHNSGAEGNGLYEQDLTFDIGHRLAALLAEDRRFEVCLSRPYEDSVLGSDNISSLKARLDGALLFEADYFISLHINAFTQESANGVEVFVSGKDMESFELGHSLLRGMLDSTGLKDRGITQDGELYVLKNATMPAVLLEMGFISNAGDAAMLSEHPELFAQGIYEGICKHFEIPYALEMTVLLWTIGIFVLIDIMMVFALYTKGKRK